MWKPSRTAPFFARANQRRGSPRHSEGRGNLTGPVSVWLRKRKAIEKGWNSTSYFWPLPCVDLAKSCKESRLSAKLGAGHPPGLA